MYVYTCVWPVDSGSESALGRVGDLKVMPEVRRCRRGIEWCASRLMTGIVLLRSWRDGCCSDLEVLYWAHSPKPLWSGVYGAHKAGTIYRADD